MADDRPDYRSNVVPFSKVGAMSLSGGAIGGGGDGMEPRIAKLEADMDHVKRQLGEVANRVASISDKQTDQRVEFLGQFSGQKSALDANFAELKTEIAVMKERMTHFATKTYSIVTAFGIVTALSALILFAERLKNLLGI